MRQARNAVQEMVLRAARNLPVQGAKSADLFYFFGASLFFLTVNVLFLPIAKILNIGIK
jgi:uncharacterized membrane protein